MGQVGLLISLVETILSDVSPSPRPYLCARGSASPAASLSLSLMASLCARELGVEGFPSFGTPPRHWRVRSSHRRIYNQCGEGISFSPNPKCSLQTSPLGGKQGRVNKTTCSSMIHHLARLSRIGQCLYGLT